MLASKAQNWADVGSFMSKSRSDGRTSQSSDKSATKSVPNRLVPTSEGANHNSPSGRFIPMVAVWRSAARLEVSAVARRRKHASISLAGALGCSNRPSFIHDRMTSATSEYPIPSAIAIGPADIVATAACKRGHGAYLSSPYGLPGWEIVDQNPSCE